jgi:hypothetical protein
MIVLQELAGLTENSRSKVVSYASSKWNSGQIDKYLAKRENVDVVYSCNLSMAERNRNCYETKDCSKHAGGMQKEMSSPPQTNLEVKAHRSLARQSRRTTHATSNQTNTRNPYSLLSSHNPSADYSTKLHTPNTLCGGI